MLLLLLLWFYYIMAHFGAKLVASHHGMASFDKTGEEWVQKENVFIR